MITTNKKAYAGIVLSKEGKVYDVPPIDIKGLQIRKVTTPKAIREKFANILEHDILGSEIINFKDIYRQFFEIEKGIRDRIAQGDSKLLKPQAIKSIENYKDPISQAGYRGAMLWNYLHPRESISDFSSVHLANFKEKYTIEQLKGLVPDDIYEKLLDYPDYLEEINPNKNKRAKPDDKREIDRRSQYERFGIDCLAIPWDYDKAPEWIEKIVFADKIVNDMIKSGNVLLESIGFTIIDNKRNRDNFESKNASNIVRF
ncbi:family B DNA polymerase [Proteus mirabilis]|uniref:family B DNA polymerase n=1 Tax=Proteus mirabilis TaxID=584 RepID=UPI0034D3A950